MEKLNGKVSKVVASLLRFFARANHEIFGFKGAPLHDALAVSYVIDEAVLNTKFVHVDIETRGEFTRGQTVVDVYGVTRKAPNVEVAFDLDLEKFKDLTFKAIKRLDRG